MADIIKFLKSPKIGDDTEYFSSMRRFLKVGGINKAALRKIYNSVVHIKNKQKLELAATLLDQWFLYKVDNHDVYVKHVASGKLNVLNQIVLGGNNWDGIYELSFIDPSMTTEVNEEELVIKTTNNLCPASFYTKDRHEYMIYRTDANSSTHFADQLLETGFITEEELEIYLNPEPWLRKYLSEKLSKITFEDGGDSYFSNTQKSKIAI